MILVIAVLLYYNLGTSYHCIYEFCIPYVPASAGRALSTHFYWHQDLSPGRDSNWPSPAWDKCVYRYTIGRCLISCISPSAWTVARVSLLVCGMSFCTTLPSWTVRNLALASKWCCRRATISMGSLASTPLAWLISSTWSISFKNNKWLSGRVD